MSQVKNITGNVYGRITVLDDYYVNNRKSFWLCSCSCGNTKYIKANSLKTGLTKSCGCLYKETRGLGNKVHGLWKHPIYGVRRSMLNRCYLKSDPSYKDYGGRGITICDEWRNDVMSFYNWCTSNGWKHGLDIDRKNNDGIYEPSNCRFVTRKVNQNNRRISIRVDYDGRICTMDELEKINGIPAIRISHRIIHNGWSVDRAISEPVMNKPSGYKQNRRKDIK